MISRFLIVALSFIYNLILHHLLNCFQRSDSLMKFLTGGSELTSKQYYLRSQIEYALLFFGYSTLIIF